MTRNRLQEHDNKFNVLAKSQNEYSVRDVETK